MKRALLGLVGLAVAAAAGVYTQRNALERRWVDYRHPQLEAQARALLDAGLEHDDKFIRIDAAGLLARTGDPRGFGILQRGVNDFNAVARYSAVWRMIPYEERALPLVEKALQDEQSYVRDRAVYVLGKMSCAPAKRLLHRVWQEQLPIKPDAVLDALWVSTPEEAARLVVMEFDTPRRVSRAAALKQWRRHREHLGLQGYIAERDAIDAHLAQVLQDMVRADGEPGRWAAAELESLERTIAEVEATAHLHGLPQVERRWARRVRADRRAQQEEGQRLAGLRAALANPDYRRRQEAAWALHQHPTTAALALADDRLADEDVRRVREPLLRLLLKEAPELAVDDLIATVRQGMHYPFTDAAHVIPAMADPVLVPAYEAGLGSEHRDVRLAVVHALCKVRHPDRRRLLARAMRDPQVDIRIQAAAGYLSSS